MDTKLPLLSSGEPRSRLDVGLLGQFEVAVDGKVASAERWPSLRATHLVQLLSR